MEIEMRKFVIRNVTGTGVLAALAASSALAAPGTPTDVMVRVYPSSASVSFRNTAQRDELVRFELDHTANGVRMGRIRGEGSSGTGDGWRANHTIWVRGLEPESEHCFRVWAVDDDGDYSEKASAWACGRIPPNPPLEPLDFKAELVGNGDVTPRLSWNTPDQSGHRGIARFVVERQSPSGANRPWIQDVVVAGPAGEQTAATRLAFAVEGSAIDPAIEHLYRVCAQNDGGSACATATLTGRRTLVEPAANLRNLSNIQAATGAEAAALFCRGGAPYPTGRYGQVPNEPEREWHIMFIRRSQLPAGADGSGLAAGECAYRDSVAEDALAYIRLSVELGSDTLQQLADLLADPGRYSRFVVRRDATGVYDAVEHGEWQPETGGLAVPPAAEVPAPAISAGPGRTPPVIVVGGRELYPAQPTAPSQTELPPQASRATAPATAAPQPAQTQRATAPAASATQPRSSAPVEIGPTPVRPRGPSIAPRTVPEVIPEPTTPLSNNPRREGTVLEAPASTPGSTVLRDGRAAPAVPRGETRLQTSPSSGSNPAARAAANAEIRTEDLICRGGPELRFEGHGRDPETNLTRARLYFGLPKKTASDRQPAAGADGVWLDPATCAFANREWTPGDPPAVQFEALEGTEAAGVREHLSDDSRYWRFAVYRTAYGYFQTVRHQAWQPATPARTLREWRTPEYGGPGGAPFEAVCDVGSYLVGVDARLGHDLDAVAPLCARLRPDGSRGAVTVGPRHGGTGGDPQQIVCPEDEPFVRSMTVMWEGRSTVLVDTIIIRCGPIRGALRNSVQGYNLLSVDGPLADGPKNFIGIDDDVPVQSEMLLCPDGFAYAGFHGRAYAMVDALGAVCRERP